MKINDEGVLGPMRALRDAQRAAGVRHAEMLGDGSLMTLEDVALRTVSISRIVNGECVFGQVFAYPSDEEWPGAWLTEVMQSMRDEPGSFDRRTLWDREGRAVR